MDVDSSHEIKRHLLVGKKAVTNLDSVLKIRDTTLLTKAYIVKAMVSLVTVQRGRLRLKLGRVRGGSESPPPEAFSCGGKRPPMRAVPVT